MAFTEPTWVHHSNQLLGPLSFLCLALQLSARLILNPPPSTHIPLQHFLRMIEKQTSFRRGNFQLFQSTARFRIVYKSGRCFSLFLQTAAHRCVLNHTMLKIKTGNNTRLQTVCLVQGLRDATLKRPLLLQVPSSDWHKFGFKKLNGLFTQAQYNNKWALGFRVNQG